MSKINVEFRKVWIAWPLLVMCGLVNFANGVDTNHGLIWLVWGYDEGIMTSWFYGKTVKYDSVIYGKIIWYDNTIVCFTGNFADIVMSQQQLIQLTVL